jgi:hypothetical protein
LTGRPTFSTSPTSNNCRIPDITDGRLTPHRRAIAPSLIHTVRLVPQALAAKA